MRKILIFVSLLLLCLVSCAKVEKNLSNKDDNKEVVYNEKNVESEKEVTNDVTDKTSQNNGATEVTESNQETGKTEVTEVSEKTETTDPVAPIETEIGEPTETEEPTEIEPSIPTLDPSLIPILFNPEFEPIEYNVTVEDELDYVTIEKDKYYPGETVLVDLVIPNNQSSLSYDLFVNGEYSSSGYCISSDLALMRFEYEYEFIMPNNDVTLSFREVHKVELDFSELSLGNIKESNDQEIIDAFNKRTSNYYESVLVFEFDVSNSQYGIRIFKIVGNDTHIYYYAFYNNELYSLVPFNLNPDNYNGITQVVIGDANKDGYLEIYSSVVSFKDRSNYFYMTSFLLMTDTKTKRVTEFYDYNNISYFSLYVDHVEINENVYRGVLYILNTNEKIKPIPSDANGDVLNSEYRLSAINTYDVGIQNTRNVYFKNKYLVAECDTFRVEMFIKDNYFDSPLIFSKSLQSNRFDIHVTTTWLGESEKYTSPVLNVQGATIKFTNSEYSFMPPYLGLTAICDVYLFKGYKINNVYQYNIRKDVPDGLYDMKVEFHGEKFVIKDFLQISDSSQIIYHNENETYCYDKNCDENNVASVYNSNKN